MFIRDCDVRLIKNSRKEKTIEIRFKTFKGEFYASAPSGKSTGKHEVMAYNEKGIEHSMKLLRVFLNKIKGKNFMARDFSGLYEFEEMIRKFEARVGRMGANVTYVLEAVFLKAVAKENKKDLWKFIFDSFYSGKVKMPMPVANVIGGGLHSNNKKELAPDFQEFEIIPNEKTFSKAVTKVVHTHLRAKRLIKKYEKKFLVKKNDENAWKTKLTNEQVLEVLKELGKTMGVRIGLDVAASSFYNSYYKYKNKELIRDRTEQIEYIGYLIKKFNLFYIEDPLNEEDFIGFANILKDVEKRKNKSLIVGDDLTVTSISRLKRAIRDKSINAIIIKPNQNGYLTEVAKVVELCKRNNIKMIFSHRSGETMDTTIADLCVGFQGDFIKCGANGKERLIKFKRIMDIEKSL